MLLVFARLTAKRKREVLGAASLSSEESEVEEVSIISIWHSSILAH